MQQLQNWIPYKLVRNIKEWQLLWLDMDDRHPNEPFFDETISLCRYKMLDRSRFQPLSSLDFLIESAENIPALKPDAFIFHVSRCGSTLLSQMLSQKSTNLVYPEAPLLDEILRAREKDSSISEDQIKLWFLSALNMMGGFRYGYYEQLFVKLDSWHIHFYPLLRKWFPETPFYFLSRAPAAVIASHHRRRGIHAVPGMVDEHLLQVNLREAHHKDFDLFTAEVLAAFYNKLADIAAEKYPRNYFYDYDQGMYNMPLHFLNALGLNHISLAGMQQRLAFHAKNPQDKFIGDQEVQLPFYPMAMEAYQFFLSRLNRN